MSNHASLVTTQSLPSFAQAFSSPGLGPYAAEANNALPPIQNRPFNNANQTRSRPSSEELPGALAGKKRSRQDAPAEDSHEPSTPRESPRLVRIKEEHDHPISEPSPPPQPPSPNKRRRAATLSSAPPHGSLSQLDMRLPTTDPLSASTPISPVVRGFTVRDDPAALEQVRVAASISQQQKALIEQRRGSVAGILSPRSGDGEDRISAHPKPPPASRPVRPSPTMLSASVSSIRRAAAASPRVPSPSPLIVPSQNSNANNISPAHSLPPPPISFARNRARQLGAGRKKAPPADLLISPREAMPAETFAPAVQSAPPGQAAFFARQQTSNNSGLLPMALPRLPALPATTAASSGDNGRRGIVPPTPTRLATFQRAVPGSTAGPSVPPTRSPPAASVPISASAQTFVPPTPILALGAFQQQQHARLQQQLTQQQRAAASNTASTTVAQAGQPAAAAAASSSGQNQAVLADKAAFLAPFEVFFDALTDARTLKNWLSEQLQRAQGLTRQQESMLKTQEDAAKRVDTVVKQYEDTVRRQEDAIRRMETQIAHQDSLLRQHDELVERRARELVRPLQRRLDLLEGRSPHASPPLPAPSSQMLAPSAPSSSTSATTTSMRNGIPTPDPSVGYTFPSRHSPEFDARRTSSARLESGGVVGGSSSTASSPALSHKSHALRSSAAASAPRAGSQSRASAQRDRERERHGGEKERLGGSDQDDSSHVRPAIRRTHSNLGTGVRLIKSPAGKHAPESAADGDVDVGGKPLGAVAGNQGKQDMADAEDDVVEMDES